MAIIRENTTKKKIVQMETPPGSLDKERVREGPKKGEALRRGGSILVRKKGDHFDRERVVDTARKRILVRLQPAKT